ncbi:hypothetical protein IC607_02780 [Cellulomonas sp. JH27-2]|uniref:hypothetical protein n=1 Tax=Cellulomonas sp. JH27-2 TaxID=2774139 RepID=UPI001780AF40|nr:hypothetical protein [Cellulomonas sp. JH27-2]MBD8057888.1 hypothetical protein [Cellulomonas sp. JH27-2]
MLRSRIPALLLCGALVGVAGVVVATPASADGGFAGNNDVDPSAGGGSISVTITSTGTTSGGHTFTDSVPGGVTVRPQCWLTPGMSGKEFWDYWKPGGPAREADTMDDYAYGGHLPKAMEDHKDDDGGHWYGPMCQLDTPGDITLAYQIANAYVWVDANDDPPAAAILVDPEVLAKAAYDSMKELLPPGKLDWNPKVKGFGGTIVGKQTGVWLEDASRHIEVTASIPGGTWARVDADRTDVAVTADDATSVPCEGVTYPAPAADTACLSFDRSTAYLAGASDALPTTTMMATSTWTAGWVSSQSAARTDLPAQTVTADAQIAVAEIQSVVNP